MAKTRIAILGASGYTGAELLRLLLPREDIEIAALTAERNAGLPVGAIWPQFADAGLPDLCKIAEVDFKRVDFVFCALPHGTTQEVIAALPDSVRIVDLSADFRLSDCATYEKWYGQKHRAPQLQEKAVYGLTEHARDLLPSARLVANPGCYPTAAQLPLIPLLKAGLIEADEIIIDAKSGVSGAGREAKVPNLFAELSEGFQAYGVAAHRHTPEIEQGLGLAAGKDLRVAFTPHLVPMSRGIFATIYVRCAKGAKAADLRAHLMQVYQSEVFVQMLAEGALPNVKHVRGTNKGQISVFEDRLEGRAIILSVIDNLVKGASGQAVQNMNAMLGLPETVGLMQGVLWP
jgi:N-acetyl-gamma-glutamyl-phosphate reductase